MTGLEGLAARLDRVEAELALHRLVYEYCAGADHRDLARWRGVWTPDAVWQVRPDQQFVGVDAICEAVEWQWRTFQTMQHATTNHVVTVDGASATGSSDVLALIQLRDGRWIAGGATYQDQYRRDDGGWRIARREVVRPFDLAPLAPSAGPIYDDETAEPTQ